MGEMRVLVVAFLLAGAARLNASDIQGRLLTPDDGCGFQPPIAIHLLQFLETWPWVGSVISYSSEIKALTSTCTATLITSRHALTSGFCVNDQVRYVRLGETPKKNTTEFIDFRVIRIELHPEAGWSDLRSNLAILFLESDVKFEQYSNRFRPVCLPLRQSILSERHGDLVFRLIRNSSFNISQATTFQPMNHTLVENAMCEVHRSNTSLGDAGFCVETDGVSGQDGDPFMVRVYERGTFPIYQIGLDAYHSDENPAPILYLYPYVEWIKDTVVGNTKNMIIVPLLRADERKN